MSLFKDLYEIFIDVYSFIVMGECNIYVVLGDVRKEKVIEVLFDFGLVFLVGVVILLKNIG